MSITVFTRPVAYEYLAGILSDFHTAYFMFLNDTSMDFYFEYQYHLVP